MNKLPTVIQPAAGEGSRLSLPYPKELMKINESHSLIDYTFDLFDEKNKNVQFINNVQYTKIDDEGLHYMQDETQKVLAVDHVIICAGQVPCKELAAPLEAEGIKVHVIGGADVAAELDAKRAINQACLPNQHVALFPTVALLLLA
mgnify:CR=1 FL=1